WNLVPISQGITRFNARARRPATTVEPFKAGFHGHTEPVRQSHFDFLGKQMIRRPMPKSVPLIYSTQVERPRREHISSCERGEARTRKSPRRPISAADIVTRHNNRLIRRGLCMAGGIKGQVPDAGQGDAKEQSMAGVKRARGDFHTAGRYEV